MVQRALKFRWLTERIRGVQSESFRAERDGFSARAVLLAAIAMFVVVFVLRLRSDSVSAGYALFFTLPIALLALRFGVRGGLAAAVIAEALFVLWGVTGNHDITIVGYLGRATAFVTLGLLVGYLSQQLADNEARFGLSLRSSPIFVYTMDRQLRYTWIYHGWTGRLATEMIGKSDTELVDAEYATPIVAFKRRVLESGEPDVAELPVLNRAGELRWFRISVEPTRDATGRITGLTGAALDISDLRSAYIELSRSEERFRTAVENMLEPFAIYSAVRDENDTIIDFCCDYINPPGAASVSLAADELTGERLSKLFPGRLEYSLVDRYAEVIESGEPYVNKEFDFVNVFGEQTLVRAFDIRVAKFGDGVEVTWSDVTDKARAEHERDWAAAIVESSIDAIFSADVDGIIRSWSVGATRLYGWQPEEVIGKHFQMIVAPEQRDERSDRFAHLVAGESIGPAREIETTKDGSRIEVTFTAAPIKDAAGEVVGVSRIVRPITSQVVATRATRA